MFGSTRVFIVNCENVYPMMIVMRVLQFVDEKTKKATEEMKERVHGVCCLLYDGFTPR